MRQSHLRGPPHRNSLPWLSVSDMRLKMSQVPAATRALEVLKLLASAPGPMTASGIARALSIPRSSAYHLLDAMRASGFVVHLPEDERWGLGVAAFEIGAAYSRHDPLVHLAKPLLQQLVREAGSAPVVAYLGVLHATETLYVAKVESKRLPIVTEVGVRLPAALTASGRAMLAALPHAQVRANFSTAQAFVDRTGLGPRDWRTLRALLDEERRRGYSEEDGFISPGFASLAAAVRNHVQRPVAAIGVTFASQSLDPGERLGLAHRVRWAAEQISTRLGAR